MGAQAPAAEADRAADRTGPSAGRPRSAPARLDRVARPAPGRDRRHGDPPAGPRAAGRPRRGRCSVGRGGAGRVRHVARPGRADRGDRGSPRRRARPATGRRSRSVRGQLLPSWTWRRSRSSACWPACTRLIGARSGYDARGQLSAATAEVVARTYGLAAAALSRPPYRAASQRPSRLTPTRDYYFCLTHHEVERGPGLPRRSTAWARTPRPRPRRRGRSRSQRATRPADKADREDEGRLTRNPPRGGLVMRPVTSACSPKPPLSVPIRPASERAGYGDGSARNAAERHGRRQRHRLDGLQPRRDSVSGPPNGLPPAAPQTTRPKSPSAGARSPHLLRRAPNRFTGRCSGDWSALGDRRGGPSPAWS